MDEHLSAVRTAVSDSMPRVLDELATLVEIPSVSWDSFDPSHVEDSAQAVAQLLRELDIFESVSISRSRRSDTGKPGNPAVLARREPKVGMPTVLLYAHHDVQPPGESSEWNTPAFNSVIKDGRMYGRGAADDKAGIMSHVASLRALKQLCQPIDIGLVVFIEGEEEAGSPSFTNFLSDHHESLESDVIIVADSNNYSESIPALTVSLRGNVTLNLTVSTLDHAVHSGMFGGLVPDAFMALNRLISSFYDEDGCVSISGVHASPDEAPIYSEDLLRAESGVLPEVQLIGRGSLLGRIWNQASLTVTGIDFPSVSNASNTLVPSIGARVSLRVPPGQSASPASDALVSHINSQDIFGARVTITDINVGEGFMADEFGTASLSMRNAMKHGWGVDPVNIGVGGSIPFISAFTEAFPSAQVLVTGVEDPDSRAHSPNESLHLAAFEKAILSQTLFLMACSDN